MQPDHRPPVACGPPGSHAPAAGRTPAKKQQKVLLCRPPGAPFIPSCLCGRTHAASLGQHIGASPAAGASQQDAASQQLPPSTLRRGRHPRAAARPLLARRHPCTQEKRPQSSPRCSRARSSRKAAAPRPRPPFLLVVQPVHLRDAEEALVLVELRSEAVRRKREGAAA